VGGQARLRDRGRLGALSLVTARLSFWLPSRQRVFGLGAALGMSHAAARQLVVAGFTQVFSRPPSLLEAQFVQAVALLETGYGNWSGPCAGSNNMGSIQDGHPPCDPANSCQHTDKHADGTPYEICFKRYPSAFAGFQDLVHELYVKRPSVLQAAQQGSIAGVAAAMRASHYYEAPLKTYTAGLTKDLGIIAAALHEPMPSPSASPWPWTEIGLAALVATGAYYVTRHRIL
jgi:hypothetical protein